MATEWILGVASFGERNFQPGFTLGCLFVCLPKLHTITEENIP